MNLVSNYQDLVYTLENSDSSYLALFRELFPSELFNENILFIKTYSLVILTIGIFAVFQLMYKGLNVKINPLIFVSIYVGFIVFLLNTNSVIVPNEKITNENINKFNTLMVVTLDLDKVMSNEHNQELNPSEMIYNNIQLIKSSGDKFNNYSDDEIMEDIESILPIIYENKETINKMEDRDIVIIPFKENTLNVIILSVIIFGLMIYLIINSLKDILRNTDNHIR